jgi:hypothetical protein
MKGTIGRLSLEKAKQDADEIRRDQAYVDRAISPEGYSMERGLGPTLAAGRLRKDSDEGRYAAPGYGDQGQFFGGSGKGGARPNTDEELTSGKSAMKKGGKVKKMASGGMTSGASSASKRADGIAVKGKTRGKMC